MRHRSAAAAARAAAEGPAPRAEPRKQPQEVSPRTACILIGLVACLPALVWVGLKWVLPDHQHAKLLTVPKMRLSLEAEEVLAHLRNHTLLHLGGVHRSGNSLLVKGLALHPDVAQMEHQPGHDARHAHWIKKSSDGVFLQSVYPKFGFDHKGYLLRKWFGRLARKIPFLPDGMFTWMGMREGIGRFALDPGHRLSEASPLVHERAQQVLFNQWALFWDLSKPVLMEKSPSNGVISPFLHRLWGLGLPSSPARFIFIQRHPIAVALATLRMGGPTVRDLEIADLVENWVAAEERRAEDLRQYFSLHEDPEAPPAHRTVTLEELVRQPKQVLNDLMLWLALAPPEEDILAEFENVVIPDPNKKYFTHYCLNLLEQRTEKSGEFREYARIVERFADRVLAVSPYDLREVPSLCKEVLIKPLPSNASKAAP